jgi:two-component system, NarL family, nitrate/nitrite response regulator NarL
MRTAVPTIVTHPCTLFRDGLRQILGNTPFRPIHLAAEFDQAAINHLTSAESCLWLLGLEKCSESTFDLVRRVCKTAPSLKTIILAQLQTADDVWPAIEAGARGFLYQNISSERLVKSLELIALGEILVPTDFLYAVGNRLCKTIQSASPAERSQETAALHFRAGQLLNGKTELSANGKDLPSVEDSSTATIRGLSRRETSILHLLMQGTSNKVIARQLVITEATVKVHIKAILRKLRLHNRTQAAMWACNHLGIRVDDPNWSGNMFLAHADRIALGTTKS